jgi:hypothetical protein
VGARWICGAFLVAWHFSGEKSNVGTLVDSVPGVVGAAYILLSRRVRSTFIRVAGTVTAERDQAEG